MLFNFGNSKRKYSSNRKPVDYLKRLYHQQSFSEIADEHVNNNPYLYETSNEIMDDVISHTPQNETSKKTNE